MRTLAHLVPLAALLIAPTALAGGKLARKEGFREYQKNLDEKLAQVNKACGTQLKGSYDQASYKDFDPLKDRTESACKQAVGTLAAVCATQEGKEAVRADVRETVCRFSTEGTKATLNGGVLTIHIDPEKSSIVGKEKGSYSWKSALHELL